MVGYLAYPKAGRDLRKIYLIIKEEAECVYLADGITRTYEKPKKKNKKHIQVIKKFENPEVTKLLLEGKQVDVNRLIQEVQNVKSRCN